MRIGYARVSTIEQHEERQLVELQEKADVERTFLDKLSGKNTERPELQKMIDFAREGDTIYVSEFSRLARSTKDLLDIVQKLKDKNVQVVSLKESFDTTTPAGELAMTLFAAIAKTKGVYRGRHQKKKPVNWKELVEKYQRREIRSVSELMRICDCSRPTIYNWLKESGITIEPLKWKPYQKRL